MRTAVIDELDNAWDDPQRPIPLVTGGHDFTSVTEKVCAIVEQPKPPRAWYLAFGASLALTGLLFAMIGLLVLKGIGVWGLNVPVGWAFDITNFVFWVGIGHAGTLISAILFLLRQKWRTSINRFAEAMTIFAVICALVFPTIHVGRIWLVWWLLPLPNFNAIWPNFRSPLLWDVFAVGTYATVSLLFWYTGMVPDLATLRDRAASRGRAAIYGLLALGWRGSARQWHRYQRAYLLLAALATPLVISVHSVVSYDFAVSQLPGWHATLFPPYFVAGAILSGVAMVLTLMVPARHLLGLRDLVAPAHLEALCKIALAAGSLIAFAHVAELYVAFQGDDPYQPFTAIDRALGPYRWLYWASIAGSVVAPQLFWFARCRRSPWLMVGLCVAINLGMWLERFLIVVTSLGRSMMPSAWHLFSPTWLDLATLAGSFGLFSTLFLLFVRYLPLVAIAEVKRAAADAEGAA
jgi:molybdopterin-containing oxidoreductase family membrane subunit